MIPLLKTGKGDNQTFTSSAIFPLEVAVSRPRILFSEAAGQEGQEVFPVVTSMAVQGLP